MRAIEYVLLYALDNAFQEEIVTEPIFMLMSDPPTAIFKDGDFTTLMMEDGRNLTVVEEPEEVMAGFNGVCHNQHTGDIQ